MTITRTICDRCGCDCKEEFFTIYRQSCEAIISKEDICVMCFDSMFKEDKE